MNVIPYGRQDITDSDIDAVVKVLKSDYLTQGPVIEQFEKSFAEYVGAKYAVAVSNGTAALHLCAMAMDLTPGQKVITSPITFAATANCIRYLVERWSSLTLTQRRTCLILKRYRGWLNPSLKVPLQESFLLISLAGLWT